MLKNKINSLVELIISNIIFKFIIRYKHEQEEDEYIRKGHYRSLFI